MNGITKLTTNVFPELQGYTNAEKDRALLLYGVDYGTGLTLLQTIPKLAVNGEVLLYNTATRLRFPMLETAIEKEYIHAKVICALNNALGADTKAGISAENSLTYAVVFVFIHDGHNKNFKLADMFLGEIACGHWANVEQVRQMAVALQVPYYTKMGQGGI
jgi:hypothetical protein